MGAAEALGANERNIRLAMDKATRTLVELLLFRR
jgi:hypothetical protein